MAEKKKKDKKWIQKAVKNPGSFTAKAKKSVEANPDKYDEATRKQAQLRETLVKLNKKKKAKK
jgi:hypothetical protein